MVKRSRWQPRFIVDSMLGSLARWLRLLGYDTLYAKGWHDSRIIEKALEENRILLTRDHGLYVRARRRGVEAAYVGEDVAEALALLSLRYGIALEIDTSRSRCPHCNAPLRPASPEEVKPRVPPRVLERTTRFWVCTGCGQVYWVGGHWRGIEARLAEARKILSELRGRGSAIEGLATG